MSDAKFTDQQLIDDVEKGLSMREIAKKYDVNMRTISKRKVKLNLVDYHKKSLCPDGYKIKGNSSLYDKNGNLISQWVKTTIDPKAQQEVNKILIEEFKKEIKPLQPTKEINKNYTKDCLCVYPLGDPHIGMYVNKDLTNKSSWNLEIAKETYAKIFNRLISSSPDTEKCVIINLGDFFHYDNLEGVTSRRKNVLERDDNYYMMVRVGIHIMRQLIADCLTKHKHVTVINAMGNHDDCSAIFLSETLKHVYQNDERVTVQDTKSPFNYFQFGKTLLGVHHGHTVKPDQLPSVLATDKPQEWGTSSHRYWLTGHIHHDSVKEYSGCIVESFRTLAPLDNYAYSHGYRSGRSTKAIVYHNEHGEIERHTINIEV